MPSISLDNGESIVLADGTSAGDPFASVNALANSVADLMGNRERFDYTWANSTERTAQTGMVQGSRGYQEDTKTEYIYDPTWRLALPWAEFTASKTGSDSGSTTTAGTLSLDATQSTDSVFVVPGASGILTLVRPGVYLISVTAQIGIATTGRTFVEILYPGSTVYSRSSIVVGEDTGTLTAPVRTVSDNTSISVNFFKTVGGSSTTNTRVRIARIG